MKVLLFALSVVLLPALNADLLGPEDDSQELFIYRQRNYAVHQLLKSRCPDLIRFKRKSLDDTSLPLALSAEKIVYNRLLKSLVECTTGKSLKSGNSSTEKLLTTKDVKTGGPLNEKATPTTATTASSITTTTTTTTTTEQPLPKDCQELYDRGLTTPGEYLISLPASNLPPFKVWCDFFDDHGWTVFQKRFDGSVSFNRGWTEYKNGFGSVDGEHWLGLDKLHALTQMNSTLNILLKRGEYFTQSGTWPIFSVDNEQYLYRLNISDEGYHGTLAGSSLVDHNGMRFSTPDRDLDIDSGNCAKNWEGGWWYFRCQHCLLNGVYGATYWGGIVWESSSNHFSSSVMRVSRD